MMNLKRRQYKILLLYLRIWNAVSTKIMCGCLKDTTPVQEWTPQYKNGYGCDHWQAFWTWHWTDVFHNLYITWTIKISQGACTFNCGYSAEDFWSMWHPHCWSVSVRCLLLFDRTSGTEQLHCSNSGETFCVAIAVSWTDSWYNGVLYTEQDESRQHANANISKVSSNIIYSFNLWLHTYTL